MKPKFRIEVLTAQRMNYLGEATSDWEELVEILLKMPDVYEVRLVKVIE